MTFADTLGVVNEVNTTTRFRRPSWEDGKYIAWMVNSENRDHVNPTVELEDFVADDWEIVEEIQKWR